MFSSTSAHTFGWPTSGRCLHTAAHRDLLKPPIPAPPGADPPPTAAPPPPDAPCGLPRVKASRLRRASSEPPASERRRSIRANLAAASDRAPAGTPRASRSALARDRDALGAPSGGRDLGGNSFRHSEVHRAGATPEAGARIVRSLVPTWALTSQSSYPARRGVGRRRSKSVQVQSKFLALRARCPPNRARGGGKV